MSQHMPHYYGSSPPLAGLPHLLSGLAPKRRDHGSPRLVSGSVSVQQQQSLVTYVDASGETFSLESIRRMSFPTDSIYSPIGGASFEERVYDGPEELPSLATLVREDGRRLEKVASALEDREVERLFLRHGDHFGGYRLGKNLRQGPSIRHVRDLSGISRLVGMPVHVLASTVETLQTLQEQNNYGAWASQVSGYRP